MLMDSTAQLLAASGVKEADSLRAPIPRFVIADYLSPIIGDLAQDAAALEKSRSYLFMPSPQMWIEMMAPLPEKTKRKMSRTAGRNAELRVGALLFADDEEACVGEAIVASTTSRRADPLIAHARMNLGEPGARALAVDALLNGGPAAQIESAYPGGAESYAASMSESLSQWLIAAIALINTPRIATFVEHTFDDREYGAPRPGRWPLMSYKEVRLNVDEKIAVKNTDVRSADTHTARHHVRAHLRLRLGRVELVKAHWRGNAAFGTKLPIYSVGKKDRRDE